MPSLAAITNARLNPQELPHPCFFCHCSEANLVEMFASFGGPAVFAQTTMCHLDPRRRQDFKESHIACFDCCRMTHRLTFEELVAQVRRVHRSNFVAKIDELLGSDAALKAAIVDRDLHLARRVPLLPREPDLHRPIAVYHAPSTRTTPPSECLALYPSRAAAETMLGPLRSWGHHVGYADKDFVNHGYWFHFISADEYESLAASLDLERHLAFQVAFLEAKFGLESTQVFECACSGCEAYHAHAKWEAERHLMSSKDRGKFRPLEKSYKAARSNLTKGLDASMPRPLPDWLRVDLVAAIDES
ncbi:hypothetical protein H9P43_008870 [Blastocladiella emersonii ATCC 22665]|nr:hypothetical protein H9P43_008870 [Blastocladiella emersonii ATCC 22665]